MMTHSNKLTVIGLALGLAIVASATSAAAQVKRTEAAAAAKGPDSGYGYEFSDDPLNAGGFGPNDATIRVRKKAARTTLIRPRTSFVNEMLKSVENL
jgi:hypothetical protein